MNIEKINEILSIMNKNGATKLKFKDANTELELELKGSKTSNETVDAIANETKSYQEDSTNNQGNGQETIHAELIGTFFLQDEEELTNPVVQVGDKVEVGQVIGYIEAMKVLNEIKSDKEGIVEEIHVEHGQSVEYDQKIFTLK